MRPATAADVHTPRMRQAGRDLLSLGLMDARNLSLRWLALFESANALRPAEAPYGVNTPAWELGHIAWFQEHWIARNVQRQRGPAAGPQLPRLASIDPHADRRFDPSQSSAEARRQLDLPDGTGLRQYLAETIETTLELLESADETDDALYVFRLALLHEDLRAEALATTAQALGVAVGPRGADAGGVLPDIATLAPRAPLLFPATRWSLGTLPGGFVFEAEKWAHEIRVPEFEIDAQPVTWAQYAEFVEDGGYDEPRWWSAAGWQWLGAEGRRVPRHVDQIRQGVLQRRFGRLARVPLAQPVLHVNAHEAEAWCRWAGRRLPTEVEWDLAAHAGASRGFQHGAVWEWTASTLRPYPGHTPDPWSPLPAAAWGRHRVLRGGSFATRPRLRDPAYRHAAAPERDDLFSGFRSCPG